MRAKKEEQYLTANKQQFDVLERTDKYHRTKRTVTILLLLPLLFGLFRMVSNYSQINNFSNRIKMMVDLSISISEINNYFMKTTFVLSSITTKQELGTKVTSIDLQLFEKELESKFKNLETSISKFITKTEDIQEGFRSDDFYDLEVERDSLTNDKYFKEKTELDNFYDQLTLIMALARSYQQVEG